MGFCQDGARALTGRHSGAVSGKNVWASVEMELAPLQSGLVGLFLEKNVWASVEMELAPLQKGIVGLFLGEICGLLLRWSSRPYRQAQWGCFWEKCVGFCSDGARALTGRHSGVVSGKMCGLLFGWSSRPYRQA